MADPLLKYLAPRTVLISDGSSVGTGFFISAQHILTCAHVVRDGLKQQKTIQVRYWTLNDQGNDQFIEKSCSKVTVTDLKEGEEYPDVAVLEIKSDFPHGMLLLPEASEEITYSREVEYVAFGYQKQNVHTGQNIPQAVSLNYEGEEDVNRNRKIIFENGLVRPGMSGSPLIERTTTKVTGIVHMTRDDRANLGAYTIPMESVLKGIQIIDPSLYDLIHQRHHRRNALKAYRRELPQFPLIQQYWKNLLIFSLILFFAFWWFFTHIGEIQKTGFFAALLVIIPIAIKLFGDWLGTEVDDVRAKARSKFASIAFNWWILGIGGIMVAGLWMFISSVWVIGSPENRELQLTMYDSQEMNSGRITHLDESHQAYFLVPLLHQHQEIRLKPEGREPVVINVLRGKRSILYYPYDFKLEPVVLFRLSNDVLSIGNFDLFILDIKSLMNNHQEQFDSLAPTGSLALGNRHFEIPAELLAEWKAKIPEGNEYIKKAILEKLALLQQPSSLDLNTGDSIQVSLYMKVDSSLFFRKRIHINREHIDIPVNLLDTL